MIADIYDKLENYRYFVFKLHGKLFNAKGEDVTWKILYKIGIYCENFISYTDSFFPFKKQKEIQKLTIFLDLSPIPCPACMTTVQSGNSFPEMFLRSYECKNPNCPERSKSGRGKRFDEFGVYRYFKLTEKKNENNISEKLFSKWRKDIFSPKNDIYEMLINYYAWDNERICISKSVEIKNTNSRKIVFYKPSKNSVYNTDFEKLPITILFTKIASLLSNEVGKRKLIGKIEILNENSTDNISSFDKNQIGTAITSPPYYNTLGGQI